MVSTSVTAAVCVTLFLSLFLPVILCIIYGVTNKGKGTWTAWLLGAAGFFVSQVVIRIPLLNLLSTNQDFLSFATKHYILYSVILALSAGLFETAGRFAAAKGMEKQLTFERSFAAGLGHGGIEAIIIIGMTYVNNLLYILMINSGAYDQLILQAEQMGADSSSLYMIRDTLLSSGPGAFYLAGYERILTMVFHVAMSLLVCSSIKKGKAIQGMFLCVLLHGAADSAAPLINSMVSGIPGNSLSPTAAVILIYVFLTLVAVLSAAYILSVRKRWKGKDTL